MPRLEILYTRNEKGETPNARECQRTCLVLLVNVLPVLIVKVRDVLEMLDISRVQDITRCALVELDKVLGRNLETCFMMGSMACESRR